MFGRSLYFLTLIEKKKKNSQLRISVVSLWGPSSLIIFLILTLNPISSSLSSSSGILTVSLSGTHSSATSFYLTCSLYFYVCDRSGTFLDLADMAFCRRRPLHASSAVHITQAVSSWGFCWETSWVFLLWLALWVIREAWMSPHPVGCQALPSVVASGSCLARPGHKVNGYRTPGLVLFYWWVDSGPRRLWVYCAPTGRWSQILWLRPEYWQEELVAGVWLQTPGTPELLSDCWRGKC